MGLPKITIITPSFNQAEYLEETILSVLNQRFENLEYIVIDGGSTDHSAEIIRRYEDRLAYWVSEPDRGQAHAINKGLERATGEVVAYINSDDVYLPGAFHQVVRALEQNPGYKWAAGGCLFFGTSAYEHYGMPEILPSIPPDAATWLERNTVPQAGIFWRRELFKQYGFFDESFRYVFDYEFLIRLTIAGERCLPINRPLGTYRFHAAAKTVAEHPGFGREEEVLRERYSVRLSPSDRARYEGRRKKLQSFLEVREVLQQRGRFAASQRLMNLTLSDPVWMLQNSVPGCLRLLLFGSRPA